MKCNFEDIKLGYVAYCSAREKLAQSTEDYVRDFVGDNEYVIDGDELGTNKFCGRVLSINIPFRSLSVTDRFFIAKELADCFDTEINKQ